MGIPTTRRFVRTSNLPNRFARKMIRSCKRSGRRRPTLSSNKKLGRLRLYGGTKVAKKRVFISFDYDHDNDLKVLLAGQAEHSDSPFEISDVSLKAPLTGDWKQKIRARISRAEVVAVIC